MRDTGKNSLFSFPRLRTPATHCRYKNDRKDKQPYVREETHVWVSCCIIIRPVSNVVLLPCLAGSTVAQLQHDMVSDVEFKSCCRKHASYHFFEKNRFYWLLKRIYNLWTQFDTAVARYCRALHGSSNVVILSNLIRSIEFDTAVARRLKRAFKVDFHCRVNFYVRTDVNLSGFTCVNKIETMYGRSHVNLKVEPRSTSTFMRELSYIVSILFTYVNPVNVYQFTSVHT